MKVKLTDKISEYIWLKLKSGDTVDAGISLNKKFLTIVNDEGLSLNFDLNVDQPYFEIIKDDEKTIPKTSTLVDILGCKPSKVTVEF